MKQKLIILAIALVMGGGAGYIDSINSKKEQTYQDLQSTSKRLDEVKRSEVDLKQKDSKNTEQIKKLEEEKQQLNNQKQDLEKQVSAKQEAQRLASLNNVINVLTGTKTAYASPVSVTGGSKAFIYNHESGNNPNASNASGCYGIGQDCNGIVRAKCGANYACQDAYFSQYAQSKYGGWDNAAAAWRSKGWW